MQAQNVPGLALLHLSLHSQHVLLVLHTRCEKRLDKEWMWIALW